MLQQIYAEPPYMAHERYPVSRSAQWLRNVFKPLLAKRLPSVLYGGFKHNYITNFIQKHKDEYPYFIKVEIEEFYSSLSHIHLTVETQMAYKMLLDKPYVPHGFRKEFLPAAQVFFDGLSPDEVGIPSNASFSKAIAPLVYVPYLLTLKKRQEIKFIVYEDDILILCKNKVVGEEIYFEVYNYLQSINLEPHLNIIQQGWFASGSVTFRGYEFDEGRIVIEEEKLKDFKSKIEDLCSRKNISGNLPLPKAFIKKLNRSIAGFGHYYKYAHVRDIFIELDNYIHMQVKYWFKINYKDNPDNKQLETLGLLCLSSMLKKKRKCIIKQKNTEQSLAESIRLKQQRELHAEAFIAYLEKINAQNTEIILQLKQFSKNGGTLTSAGTFNNNLE